MGLLVSSYYDFYIIFLGKRKYKYIITLFIISVIIIDIAFALKYTNKNSLSFILLFSLLPIINAVYDWLSIGITRGLLGAIENKRSTILGWIRYIFSNCFFNFDKLYNDSNSWNC